MIILFFKSYLMILFFLMVNYIKFNQSLKFNFKSQSEFNNVIQTLNNYANKQYLKEIYLDGYTSSWKDINNISGISVLAQCTALEKIYFRLSYLQNLPSNGLDQYINAIKDLKHVTYLHTYFYYVKQNNPTNMKILLNNFKNLDYFHFLIARNGVSQICPALQYASERTKLTYFYVHFANNQVSDISCFKDMFKNLVQLKQLYIVFSDNSVNSLSVFQNAFNTLDKCETLYFYGISNAIPSYSMQNSLLSMVNLKYLTFELGPAMSTGYRCNIPNNSENDLYINRWGPLFAPAKDKITHFEFNEHWVAKPLAMNQLATHLGESYLPNLESVNIYRVRPHPSHSYVVPALNHRNIKTFQYRIHQFNEIKNLWGAHKNLFANLPNLKNPMVYLGYCQFTNADMNGYSQMFSQLAGREFDSFQLNIYYNQFTSYSNLHNTQGAFSVTKEYFSYYQHLNQIKHFSGLQTVLESFVKPQNAKKLMVYSPDMQMNDVSKLGESLQNYSDLTELNLQLQNNQISDLSQLNGVYDNKNKMEKVFLYVRENPYMDQSVLNEVFLPITYYFKPILKQFDCDLKHPAITATTSSYTNMEIDSEYPAILKYGYCLSNYQMAKRFQLGTNICLDCVNENCHSCSKSTHCDMCRISNPQRQLPLCECPIGYYGAAQHTCLNCARQCESCDNGQNCLTCVNSTPKRIVPDCICPDGYYDDGIQDQCQECKLGCFACKDGMSCKSCIDGYYQKGSQCLICPQHFAKCLLNEDTQEIEATQCQGQNRFYILPYCQCIGGYYPIPNFQDCIPCNIKCTECTSSKKCQACAVKFYHDPSDESCNRCNPLCKTCSQGDSCDTCYDRQFDPATMCQQKFTAGNSSSNNTTGGNTTDSNNGSINDSGSTDGTNSISGDESNNVNGSDTNDSGSNSGINNDGNDNVSSGGFNNGSSDESGTGSSEESGNDGTGNGSRNDDNNSNNNNTDEGSNVDTNQALSLVQLNSLGGFIKSDGLKDPIIQESSKASFSVVTPDNTTIIKNCQRQCASCEESSNKCLECYPGFNKQNNPPLCSCKFGYHNKNNTTDDCFQCNSQCATCMDQEQCTSCRESDNRILNQATLKCDCMQGFKSVRQNMICQQCFQYKDECLIECPTNTVLDRQQQLCQEISFTKLNSSHSTLYITCGILIVILGLLSKFILSKQNLLSPIKFQQLQEISKYHQDSQKNSDDSPDEDKSQDKISNASINNLNKL